MDDVVPFALLVGIVCGALWLGVVSNELASRVGVPAPAFFLVGAAAVASLVPQVAPASVETVQRIVTVALLLILFNGGMDIGMTKFSRNAKAITWVGVAGTFVTAAAVAAAAHGLFGMDWRLSLLLGAALAPTDPAVVFSVLGKREIAGRAGTILEGESGANDPVGIALMVALLAAGSGEASGMWDQVVAGTLEFSLQMGIGAALGVAGGLLLVRSMQRRALPSESLYPLRTLVAAGAIYSVTTLAHGSGFLAVFIAGIIAGDARAPYKRDVERFHGAVASLCEIAAFTVLGLTVDLRTLGEGGAWLEGFVLAVLLAVVIRPLLVGVVLLPVSLTRGERVFVLWAGLKGAVPVLLGSYVLTSDVGHQVEAYDIVFVVVLFSVLVQGGSVPWAARRLGLPMHVQEPEPWSLGVRFRDEPQGVHRFVVGAGAPADGHRVAELPLGEDVWISLVERDGELVQVRGSTVLQAGDGVIVLAEPQDAEHVQQLFTTSEPAAPT